MENKQYTVEHLARLKEEKGINKHLKRLYDYFYRAAKAELEAKDNAKTLLRAENTLLKLEAGVSIDNADKQHLRNILGAIKGGNILTEQEKKELKRGTKDSYR